MRFPWPTKSETIIDLTAGAARWSLLAIAGDDAKVRAELENFALTADEKDLRAIFNEACTERARKLLSAKAIERINRANAQ